MGILDSVERGLERVVNGAFARTFRSGVQPIEISAALKRELDIQSIVVDRDRIITANEFAVHVSEADAETLQGHGSSLISELTQLVHEHADAQDYQFLGPVSIVLLADPSLTTGVLEVKANKPNAKSSWVPAVLVNGKVHPLTKPRTVIGRSADSDIQIDDTAASRAHAEIIQHKNGFMVRDMNSTNGTKLNGSRFRELVLNQNTEFTIGKTTITYQLVPVSARKTADPAAHGSFFGGSQ